jgi:ABC-type sugar transport system ATPase subunit
VEGGLAEGSVIYEAKALQKHYAAVVALSDGNFQLREGELHVIVGDNGAGKSTMLKCLAGAIQPDGGQILLDRQPVVIHGPKRAAGLGISTVFQDLALIDHLDAGANMFLGREILYPKPLSWLGILNKRAMRRRATAEVKRLRVGIRSVDQLVMGMSGGQRQAVAVARAVAFGTRIVLLDEPTAALGVRETAATLELIMGLRAQGLSIVMISHNLPNVFEVADRITVLRLGRTVATVDRRQTDLTEVVSLMTGAQQSAVASLEHAGG